MSAENDRKDPPLAVVMDGSTELDALTGSIVHLDGRAMQSKQEMLLEFARALSFPDYYGVNWDALDECLNDLSWLKSKPAAIVIGHAALVLQLENQAAAETLSGILTDAAAEWQARTHGLRFILIAAPRELEIVRGRFTAAVTQPEPLLEDRPDSSEWLNDGQS